MIRLAAFDLDGTLMGEDQVIRPDVRRAVARARESGVVVTLATGRMFSATLPFAETLNVTAPLICYQGGWVQARGGEVLHRIALPPEHAQAALDLGEAHGWHAVLYADGRLFLREMLLPERFYYGLLGTDITVGTPWAQVLREHTADKVLYVAQPPEIPAMAQALRERFDGKAEVVQSHARFVEVVPHGVEKGAALAWLAEHLGVAQSDVLAAGDQGNDLSLVRWAGVGVAMGNATPEVKAAATWIAPPVTEDGAVAILERFVFGGGEP